MTEQRTKELKSKIGKDEFQEFYDSHTYRETLIWLQHEQGCLQREAKELFSILGIVRKTRHRKISQEEIEKRRQGMIAKYGVDNPQRSSELKEKRRQTLIDRYGVSSPMRLDEVKRKRANTCLERYGVDDPFKSEEIKKKIKETKAARKHEETD